jgi:hypothetical protein
MIKSKKILKSVIGVVSCVALIVLISMTPFNKLKAEQPVVENPNACCLNGYKLWQDPNPLEPDSNFQHCGCTFHKGNDPIACSCPVD